MTNISAAFARASSWCAEVEADLVAAMPLTHNDLDPATHPVSVAICAFHSSNRWLVTVAYDQGSDRLAEYATAGEALAALVDRAGFRLPADPQLSAISDEVRSLADRVLVERADLPPGWTAHVASFHHVNLRHVDHPGPMTSICAFPRPSGWNFRFDGEPHTEREAPTLAQLAAEVDQNAAARLLAAASRRTGVPE